MNQERSAVSSSLPSTPPAADASTAEVTAPSADETMPPAEPAEEAGEFPWTGLLAGGAIVGGAVALTRAFEQRAELNDVLRRIEEFAPLMPMRAPSLPAAAPPRAAEPTPWGVTSLPKHVTFDWCYRFLWRTAHEKRAELVTSRASRSQYIRIAKVIPAHWGEALDARGVTFHVQRWIAAPQDFAERQARYMSVMRGEGPIERPAELRASWRMPKLPKKLVRSRKVVTMTAGAETSACAPGSAVECSSLPPAQDRARRDRRRWLPKKPMVCGEGLVHDLPGIDVLEALVRKATGQDVRLPRRRAAPATADGSCLPRPAPCPRRRWVPALEMDPPPPKRSGRHRLPGDIDWY